MKSQLSEWVFYHCGFITSCASIIRTSVNNCSQYIAINPKKLFEDSPTIYGHWRIFPEKLQIFDALYQSYEFFVAKHVEITLHACIKVKLGIALHHIIRTNKFSPVLIQVLSHARSVSSTCDKKGLGPGLVPCLTLPDILSCKVCRGTPCLMVACWTLERPYLTA